MSDGAIRWPADWGAPMEQHRLPLVRGWICNFWRGGDAQVRLREIRGLFDETGIGNSKSIVTMVQELIPRPGQ